MKTKIFKISENNIDKNCIEEAAEIIADNGTVAFPTETVYGLGANALNPEAVKQIFEAKGRPSDNPLIVHIASLDVLDFLVKEVPEKAKALMDAFWPGPITIILNRSGLVPPEVSAGLDTVGIRYPENKIARALIEACKLPVAAPSANLSGKPSPTKPEHVVEDLDSRVDGIITSDDSKIGIESTVINMTTEPPTILRPGIISKTEIESVIGPVDYSEGISVGETPLTPASPGMKYKHYAPIANVIIVDGKVKEKVQNFLSTTEGKTALLISKSDENEYKDIPGLIVKNLGDSNEEYAHNLFSCLRELDKENVDTILVENIEVEDETMAVFDRLLHSSNYQFI